MRSRPSGPCGTCGTCGLHRERDPIALRLDIVEDAIFFPRSLGVHVFYRKPKEMLTRDRDSKGRGII